ncbi:phosphoribosylpyrophosphate synthetase [Mucilaginibacter sp. RS28]|uniref:Phosphoribosylpyrophosphate synthetase n=1 Tax=Mucilaginibacter straminoryzae TaxID=2932774 RepID=A0A9X1X1P9_9SPHI|nr:phosphoribosylpyrophosphate synthetase [Mucilaginibacter straminoryzae]MCJ8208375.1 phosphoribosylpyrophosphate synthetase [Mucilaginibacter straminoryzae]
MNTVYDTLSEAITDLTAKGYQYNFNLNPESIYCSELNLSLSPGDFHVDGVFRFEGATDPEDNEILYAISSDEGVKGLLVDAFGTYATALNADMIAKLTIDRTTKY